MARRKSPQAQLAAIVKRKGSGRAVAQELRCSQQSVSAWMLGTTIPRERAQRLMQRRYAIPMPWTKA